MQGFTYTTALDLNMGYYTIRLDPDAQRVCMVILPWGNYLYMRLPMGIAGSPEIFQERMINLIQTLDYVRVYIDNLLTITKGMYNGHLEKLQWVLVLLNEVGLCINMAKSFFAMHEI